MHHYTIDNGQWDLLSPQNIAKALLMCLSLYREPYRRILIASLKTAIMLIGKRLCCLD